MNDEIYRVETVPPPPGEDSSYNAPTKVANTAQELLAAMKRAALEGTPLKPQQLPTNSPVRREPSLEGLIQLEDDTDAATDVVGAFTPKGPSNDAPLATTTPSTAQPGRSPIPYAYRHQTVACTSQDGTCPRTLFGLGHLLVLIALVLGVFAALYLFR